MSTKTAALPLPSSTAPQAVAPSGARTRLAAYVELTKPRITTLIVLTSAAGFALGSRKRWSASGCCLRASARSISSWSGTLIC
jgi:heme O synthase-like polyprenyltransferase